MTKEQRIEAFNHNDPNFRIDYDDDCQEYYVNTSTLIRIYSNCIGSIKVSLTEAKEIMEAEDD